jgi:hypothetical protein
MAFISSLSLEAIAKVFEQNQMAFIPDYQPPEVVQPSKGAFHLPATITPEHIEDTV